MSCRSQRASPPTCSTASLLSVWGCLGTPLLPMGCLGRRGWRLWGGGCPWECGSRRCGSGRGSLVDWKPNLEPLRPDPSLLPFGRWGIGSVRQDVWWGGPLVKAMLACGRTSVTPVGAAPTLLWVPSMEFPSHRVDVLVSAVLGFHRVDVMLGWCVGGRQKVATCVGFVG